VLVTFSIASPFGFGSSLGYERHPRLTGLWLAPENSDSKGFILTEPCVPQQAAGPESGSSPRKDFVLLSATTPWTGAPAGDPERMGSLRLPNHCDEVSQSEPEFQILLAS
jgi:hypothetical protein